MRIPVKSNLKLCQVHVDWTNPQPYTFKRIAVHCLTADTVEDVVSIPLVRTRREYDRDEAAGSISVDVSQEPERIASTTA